METELRGRLLEPSDQEALSSQVKEKGKGGWVEAS